MEAPPISPAATVFTKFAGKRSEMATTTERPTTTIYRRPRAERGLVAWLTTLDHKRIGVMYGYTAFTFFLIGGVEAVLLPVHLAQADSEFLAAGAYNSVFRSQVTRL